MVSTFAPTPPPETPLAFGPISFLPGKNGGRYPYCHSLVLKGEETWVVDPASDKDYLERLARTRRVSRVFLSHFHEDHLKYAYLFSEAVFHVPIQEVGAFTSLAGIFTLAGVEDPLFRDYLQETLTREFHFRPLSPLAPFRPGDRFTTRDIVLEVMAAPGHTPGHSCFAFPEQDLIFLADVDLTPFGPWYADATSDLEAYVDTLATLQESVARTYLTAHEQGVFTQEEAQAGLVYFLQVIEERDEQLLDLLKEPQTLGELVEHRPIYRRPREPAFVYDHMETQMLQKHLDRLLRQGRVRLTEAGYQVCR
jgi:hydroxyacylglutathione hydrolase